MKTKIKPLKNNVLVEPITKKKELESGIIIPRRSEQTPDTGKVVAIADAIEKFDVGDKIMFKKWGGIEVVEEGKEYLIIDEDDILAVIGG